MFLQVSSVHAKVRSQLTLLAQRREGFAVLQCQRPVPRKTALRADRNQPANLSSPFALFQIFQVHLGKVLALLDHLPSRLQLVVAEEGVAHVMIRAVEGDVRR